ncbi:MAG: hypothetical protein RLZZ416_222 [Candidatus Parcubacteria bacterium]|jgi:hypothetical protein
MMQKDMVAAAGVLGLGIVIAALIGSLTFYNVRSMDNTLSVTGSATQALKADSAKWSVSVSRSAYESEVPSAQSRVARDAQAVLTFFSKGGIPEGRISTTPVSVDQDYSYSNDSNAPRRYTIREQITVSSDDPSQIESLSKDIGELAAQGILVSAGQPEYYVSSLPSVRVALIGKAVEDAKARAESIAKSTGQSVGALKSASSGVVQVMQPNSVDISDYGSYDTSTIDKQVMVTARATFFIR